MGISIKGIKEVEAWKSTGGMLPVGWHTVQIERAEEGTTRTSGNPQIELEFVASNGDSIKEWLVVVPATLGKVKALLEASGVQIPEGDDPELPTRALIGKKLDVYVGLEPDYNDPTRDRRRVQGFAKPGEKAKPGASSPGHPGDPGNPGLTDDDDLPF